jgi:hypothetical protein
MFAALARRWTGHDKGKVLGEMIRLPCPAHGESWIALLFAAKKRNELIVMLRDVVSVVN